MKNKIKIEVRQQDWMPGFAGFVAGSLKTTGKAHVVINIGSLLMFHLICLYIILI